MVYCDFCSAYFILYNATLLSPCYVIPAYNFSSWREKLFWPLSSNLAPWLLFCVSAELQQDEAWLRRFCRQHACIVWKVIDQESPVTGNYLAPEVND